MTNQVTARPEDDRASSTSGIRGTRAIVFTSETSAGCMAQRRFLEFLSDGEAGRVEYVDVDDQPELAARYRVLRLPTTVFFTAGGSVERIRYDVIDTASFRRMLAG